MILVYFNLFLISLCSITSELMMVQILGLKTWSHAVYVIIPFALLGMGMGTMIYLIVSRRSTGCLDRIQMSRVLFVASGCILVAALVLPSMQIDLNMFRTLPGLIGLSWVYGMVALPFIPVGYFIAAAFSQNASHSGLLYFFDLVGAGIGGLVFYPLISWLGPFHTLILLSAVLMLAAGWTIMYVKTCRLLSAVLILLSIGMTSGLKLAEPEYRTDSTFGWECIPGHLGLFDYSTVMRKWHPLGRTDLYSFPRSYQEMAYSDSNMTFQINCDPRPSLGLFVNSYRACTPVYELSKEGLERNHSTVKLFSTDVELPYLFLNKPRVAIIGTGGGRDIFIAKSHQAQSIVGAEINPATYEAMSPGGLVHIASGGLYTLPQVQVQNIDGRHMIRNLKPSSIDFVLLNGVDTFASNATGAYAFAENYLYTSEAIQDYIHVLSDDGLVTFIRWFEDYPRETLRLFIMSLDALQKQGVREPERHVLVLRAAGWGVTLIKKSPFSTSDLDKLEKQFLNRPGVTLFYSNKLKSEFPNPFIDYVKEVNRGQGEKFIKDYWADISVVNDDSPFFYRTYRWNWHPDLTSDHPAGGSIAESFQLITLLQISCFTVLFILLPLLLFKRDGLLRMIGGNRIRIPLYFSCLGMGFIMVEMVLLQKLTLWLGSPIDSLVVTLTTLLIASGTGGAMSGRIRNGVKNDQKMILIACLILCSLTILLWVMDQSISRWIVPMSQWGRVASSVLILFPLGWVMGLFFPTGLRIVGRIHPSVVAWAWGLNACFTVLGTLFSVLIAQFCGFHTVWMIVMALYLTATWVFMSFDDADNQLKTAH